jgi:hypothetical protein
LQPLYTCQSCRWESRDQSPSDYHSFRPQLARSPAESLDTIRASGVAFTFHPVAPLNLGTNPAVGTLGRIPKPSQAPLLSTYSTFGSVSKNSTPTCTQKKNNPISFRKDVENMVHGMALQPCKRRGRRSTDTIYRRRSSRRLRMPRALRGGRKRRSQLHNYEYKKVCLSHVGNLAAVVPLSGLRSGVFADSHWHLQTSQSSPLAAP